MPDALRAPASSGRALDLLPGLGLLITLALGALSALPGLRDLPWPGELPWRTGDLHQEIEDRLDEAFLLREPSVHALTLMDYLAFGEGRPGVLIGEDDWLFTDEEWKLPRDYDAQLADKLEHVKSAKTRLAAMDIELVVALIPAKSRIYEDRLGRHALPEPVRDRYTRAHEAILEAGIRCPDLREPLRAARSEGEVFLRSDTHWTPWGAQVVARELAGALQDLPGFGAHRYITTAGPTSEHVGDLLRYLPLGPWAALGPGPDRVPALRTTEQGGSQAGLFDAVTPPVVLTGTSYSAQKKWNFAGALSEALGMDVVEAAEEGSGPVPPMKRLLDEGLLERSAPKLVIWEFPERYLFLDAELERLG